jgi:hypothetical protein
MTVEQKAHCNRIAAKVSIAIRDKYAAGQQEHGGNLWQKFTSLDLAREALAEAIDQAIYLQTLVEKLEEAAAVVARAPYA